MTLTAKNIWAQITFGPGGPPVNVRVCKKTGASWSPLFGGSGNCTGQGSNSYGVSMLPTGTNTSTMSLAANAQLSLRVNGQYRNNGYLAFHEVFSTSTLSSNGGHIKILKSGSNLNQYGTFANQTNLKNVLIQKNLADASGNLMIGSCELILATELGSVTGSAADFQDDVLHLLFS